MQKRGQLTVLLALGIVVVIAVGIYLYTQSAKTPVLPADPLDRAEAQLHACWDAADSSALRLVGIQGGWADPPDGVDQGVVVTGYAAKDGIVFMPSSDVIEQEVAIMSERLREACPIDTLGVVHDPGVPRITVVITEDKVTILTTGNATLSYDGMRRGISDHTNTIKTRFGALIDQAQAFASAVADDPDNLDILPIQREGITVTLRSFASYSWIASFLDEEDENAVIWLAGHDPAAQELLGSPTGPTVRQPAPVTLAAGETRTGILLADDPRGGPLSFLSYSPLVKVSPTDGAYIIRAGEEDIGHHVALIDIMDKWNNTATAVLEVTVT